MLRAMNQMPHSLMSRSAPAVQNSLTTTQGKYVSFIVTMDHNETSNKCQGEFKLEPHLLLSPNLLGCGEHCRLCVPSLGCVQCKDDYVLTDNLCVWGEASHCVCCDGQSILQPHPDLSTLTIWS